MNREKGIDGIAGVNVTDVTAEAQDDEIKVVNFDDETETSEQEINTDGAEWGTDEAELGGEELRKELAREDAEKLGEAALESFLMGQESDGLETDLMEELAEASEDIDEFEEMQALELEDDEGSMDDDFAVDEDVAEVEVDDERSDDERGDETKTAKQILLEIDAGAWGGWEDKTDAILSEKDSALAERIDKIAQEYQIDMQLLKKALVENVKAMEAAEQFTDENLAEIAIILNTEGSTMGAGKMFELTSEGVDRLYKRFDQWAEKFDTVKENRWRYGQILGTVARFYDEHKIDDTSFDQVGEFAVGHEQDDEALMETRYAVGCALQGRGLKDAVSYLPFWEELKNSSDQETGKYLTKSGILHRYFWTHGMDAEKERGFRENVFPNLEAGEPETEIIRMMTNAWGMRYGDYGIADWTCECLVREVNPKNTCDLLLGMRELPTVDYYKFEQNRMDAIALQGTVIAGRDFIHDQRPGVHELLAQMLEYYDSQGDETHALRKIALEETLAERLNSADGGYYRGLPERALNLGNYDYQVQATVTGVTAGREYNEPAVEILRRLVKNTDLEIALPPATKDEYLNGLMADTLLFKNAATGEIMADFGQVGRLVEYMNQQLIGLQGNLGMWPSMVKAIAWTERAATYAMRGITAKEWRELPWDSNFREMMKFQNLTMCGEKFDEGEFEEFWQKMRSEAAEDYPKNVAKGYVSLQQRMAEQIGRLSEGYLKQGFSRRTPGLRSGNLVHEFIMLAERG